MEIALATKEDAGEIQDLNQKFFHESERDFTKIIASVDMKLLIAKKIIELSALPGLKNPRGIRRPRGLIFLCIQIPPPWHRPSFG